LASLIGEANYAEPSSVDDDLVVKRHTSKQRHSVVAAFSVEG
jgi:hypothetical protein